MRNPIGIYLLCIVWDTVFTLIMQLRHGIAVPKKTIVAIHRTERSHVGACWVGFKRGADEVMTRHTLCQRSDSCSLHDWLLIEACYSSYTVTAVLPDANESLNFPAVSASA